MQYIKTLLLFLLLSSLTYAQDAHDPYENILYYPLENGMKVYLLSDPLAVNTSISLSVNVGTEVEDKHNAGISHLLEHLIFRDQRVAHHDYLDYLQDEGASDVNGYTSRYKTAYVTTIESQKSYWLVDTFVQMLFDKNITSNDLETERRALQVEIGEIEWYHPLFNAFTQTYEAIAELFPDSYTMITEGFDIDEPEPSVSEYYSLKNNHYFRLEALMKHYDTYYYPANMTLKLVGNFDIEKMKQHIEKGFGSISKSGTLKTEAPFDIATINQRPISTYYGGVNSTNQAKLGIKYLLNDYKAYLTLKSYNNYLADTLQQHLRNQLGQTYSVNYFYDNYFNAVLAGVTFDSLHDNFEENLAFAKERINQDVIAMQPDAIQKALSDSLVYYENMEHDSDRLMTNINTIEYLHKYHNLYDTNPYKILTSITPEYFQKTLQHYYQPQYRYSAIWFDYYFFPYDMLLLSFITLFLVIWGYIRFVRILIKRQGFEYSAREVLFSRRLSNRFISFIKFVTLFILTTWILTWLEYGASQLWLDGISLDYALKPPYSYLYAIISTGLFFIILIVLNYTLMRTSYVKLDVTEERLNLLGSRFMPIEKSDIVEITKVPWNFTHALKIYGAALLFFKPLVKITCNNGNSCYLRHNNADHLVEDLQQWRNAEVKG